MVLIVVIIVLLIISSVKCNLASLCIIRNTYNCYFTLKMLRIFDILRWIYIFSESQHSYFQFKWSPKYYTILLNESPYRLDLIQIKLSSLSPRHSKNRLVKASTLEKHGFDPEQIGSDRNINGVSLQYN